MSIPRPTIDPPSRQPISQSYHILPIIPALINPNPMVIKTVLIHIFFKLMAPDLAEVGEIIPEEVEVADVLGKACIRLESGAKKHDCQFQM